MYKSERCGIYSARIDDVRTVHARREDIEDLIWKHIIGEPKYDQP